MSKKPTYEELEQRVKDLEQEAVKRKRAEDAVRKAYDELEFRVEKRTAELTRGNEQLQREITERKKAQEALQEKEQFLNVVFNSIQDGISVLDSELNIIHVNHKMKQWFAHMLPLEGKKCYEAYHGRDEICEVCPTIRAFETGRLEVDEVPYIKQDKAVGTLELFAFPILDVSGKPTGMVEYVRDITAHKQAEENLKYAQKRFSKVLNSLNPLVYVSDMETYEILFINKYGRNAWRDAVGKTCWQVFQGNQTGPCNFCTNDRLVGSEGKPTGVYEWEHQNTFTNRWYYIQDQAIEWIDGRLVRLEIATDITSRMQAKQERENLISELQKTLAEVKTLRGFLPICSSCKRIRDDKGYWNQIESYIRDRSEAEFSHSICPECAKKLYPYLEI